ACMDNLRRHGLVEPVKSFVASGRPFLGICVGMQILFDESEEFGRVPGLGLLPGKIVRFAADPEGKRKVPQMGWNTLTIEQRPPPPPAPRRGINWSCSPPYSRAPAERPVIATTPASGGVFASSFWRDNVFACQFHPEKSQAAGLRLLANFAELAGETGAV